VREERRLKVFQNRGLGRIFGSKIEKEVRGYRRLHIRVIKSRRMRWVGHVVPMQERRGVCRVLVRKPDRKRQLRRPRLRWEDNIKMDLQEVGWSGHGLD